MADEKLQFSFELIDNVSQTAGEMTQASEEASDSIESMTDSIDVADDKVRQLTADLDSNQIRLLSQMAVLGSLGGAVNSINGGLQTLGLVSDETAQQLNKVTAGFNLIKGSAQALVAVKTIIATLNAQEAINAALTTYLATLKNPALLVGVGLAGGAALAVAGQYLTNNNTNNMTTNITVQDTTPAPAQEAIINLVRATEGGAL